MHAFVLIALFALSLAAPFHDEIDVPELDKRLKTAVAAMEQHMVEVQRLILPEGGALQPTRTAKILDSARAAIADFHDVCDFVWSKHNDRKHRTSTPVPGFHLVASSCHKARLLSEKLLRRMNHLEETAAGRRPGAGDDL